MLLRSVSAAGDDSAPCCSGLSLQQMMTVVMLAVSVNKVKSSEWDVVEDCVGFGFFMALSAKISSSGM